MTDAAPVPYEPLPEARLRVGDAERFEAATALGEHFATGRLDQAEYDARVQAAYAGRTRADLQALFTDLPEPAPFRPAARAGWEAGRAARDRTPPRRPAAGRAAAAAGGADRAHRAAALPGLPVLPAAVVRLGPARLALTPARVPSGRIGSPYPVRMPAGRRPGEAGRAGVGAGPGGGGRRGSRTTSAWAHRVAGRPKCGNSAYPKVVISAMVPSSIRSTSSLNARNASSPGRRR